MTANDALFSALELWSTDQCDEARAQMEKIFDTRKVLSMRIKEALDLQNQGKSEDALRLLRLAFGEAGGGTQLGELLHHMGTIQQNAGEFTDAENFLRAALVIRRESGDALGAAYSAFQIPMCRRVSGVPDNLLLEDFREAQRIIFAATDQPDTLSADDMGNMLQNLAFCFQVERDWQKALEYYREADPYRQEAGDRRGGAMTLARIAECQIEIGEMDGARENAEKALEIFQEIGDVNRIKQVEETLQKISLSGSGNDEVIPIDDETALANRIRRREEQRYGPAI